ncbi:MAG: L,D-transpeptidase family protein [Acidimicrobiales bacterium]
MGSPAHKKKARGASGWVSPRALVIGAAAVVAGATLVAATAWAISRPAPSRQSASRTRVQAPTTTLPIVPLTVTSITPAAATQGVAETSPIQVTFSAPPAPGAPDPQITPAVGGAWTQQGSTLTFQPSGGYVPLTTYQVAVPAAVTTVEHGTTVALAAPVQSSFTSAIGTYLRLQQMLAQLNYLPLSFTPAGAATTTPGAATTPGSPTTAGATTSTTSTTATSTATPAAAVAADAVPTIPVNGTFAWKYPNVPASLSSQWTPGQANVITKGAVMAFESDHAMAIDGVAGPQVWTALMQAIAQSQATTRPYDYLMVSKNLPETLTVWQNGSVVYTTPANTGVPGADTAAGTFPVFSRYASTTMTGTNVDGSKYVDPGIPWVAYFNGGDAVHGYVRPGYGYPQSNGCVELPPANAKIVWTMDPYGTLVTVS